MQNISSSCWSNANPKFCVRCTSSQASLCNAAPYAEWERRWKERFLEKRMVVSLQCLCVCVRVPVGEEPRRVIYSCSVDILPDPEQVSAFFGVACLLRKIWLILCCCFSGLCEATQKPLKPLFSQGGTV